MDSLHTTAFKLWFPLAHSFKFKPPMVLLAAVLSKGLILLP